MSFKLNFIVLLILKATCSFSQESGIDSTILSIDTATIYGKFYRAMYKTDDYFYIYDLKNSVVFKSKDFNRQFEFKDFDDDGNKDLIFHIISNNAVEYLIVFDNNKGIFRSVENFSEYPAPEPIKGTKYYYSYHKSGCADMYWDSDLFYIKDYKTIRIGNIFGSQCDKKDENYGINIYKVNGEDKKLIKTLPVDILAKYKDYKWGFLLDYWTNNYKKFE